MSKHKTKYTAGALSAFLSRADDGDAISEPKSTLSTKKAKRRAQQLIEETPSAAIDDATTKEATEEKELPTIDSAATSKRRRQSYGNVMTDEEKKRTVFVGNLPVDVTRKALKQLFSACGKIETVRLRSAIPSKPHMTKKAAVIKRELSEGQGSLIAYVKFQAPESVALALKQNGVLLDGRHVQVDSCASGKRYDDKRTVFLGNLPFDAKEEELYEHFSDCGDIEKVRLVRDRATGAGKGFGFVVFKDPTSVSFALKLSGEKFQTRDLRITRVVKKHKKKLATVTSSSGRSVKKWRKDEKRPNVKSLHSKKARSAVQNERPSKRVRESVKKRRSKKDKKSYMSTF